MTAYQFTVVIEPDEAGYHAYAPILLVNPGRNPCTISTRGRAARFLSWYSRLTELGCHSFGDTIDEAKTNIREAIGLHIEGMVEDDEPVPVEREPTLITRLSVPVAA